MKKFSGIYVVFLLFTFLLLNAFPTAGDAAIYRDVVRLHIEASGDTAEEQAVKIAVRDAIFAEYGETLSHLSDRGEAENTVRGLLSAIRETAEKTVVDAGFDTPVTVSLGNEYYGRRTYAAFSLPAGEYLSLTVTLGSGEGQNWWCVLFPPLCTGAAYGYAYDDDAIPVGLTPEEYRLITGDDGVYHVRFKILEILSELSRN